MQDSLNKRDDETNPLIRSYYIFYKETENTLPLCKLKSVVIYICRWFLEKYAQKAQENKSRIVKWKLSLSFLYHLLCKPNFLIKCFCWLQVLHFEYTLLCEDTSWFKYLCIAYSGFLCSLPGPTTMVFKSIK